ncbi:MAG TPA: hypothetical protein VD838_17800 [Anaeromyxobacteraceae bacterium]|nr:hypothetical protein [Anaeromyxobacteraceae bacterium]
MLKALGILLFAVSLEVGFLYQVVAPRPVVAEGRSAALVAEGRSAALVAEVSGASGFDGAPRRW